VSHGLVASSWVATGTASLALAGASAWYVLGPLNVLVPYLPGWFWAGAPRPAVLLSAIYAVFAWFLAFGAAVHRSRQRLRDVGSAAVLHPGLACLPVVGSFFAFWLVFSYAVGNEPRPDESTVRVDLRVRPPLVLALVTLSACSFVVYAAVLGLPVTGLWGWIERVMG
jgi:hypothetical protein